MDTVGVVYLVTGVSGHLGNVIARQLIEEGQTVRGLVLPNDQIEGKLPSGVQVFTGDITDQDSLRPFFTVPKGVSLRVIHSAGIISIASKTQGKMRATNVGGIKNILALCQEHRAEKLIYVSSVHAIPELPQGETISEVDHFHPDLVVGPYAKTKAEATALVLEAAAGGLDASVVHPSGIVGPYDYGRGHTTQLIVDYCTGRLLAAVKGGYDFVDVRDVAKGVVAASKDGKCGDCYILSNQYISVSDFLQSLHEITGLPMIKSFLPLWLAKLTAPLSERYYAFLGQPPLFTPYSLYTLASNAQFTHEKATTELGYTTRPFQVTLEDTVHWLRDQGRI